MGTGSRYKHSSYTGGSGEGGLGRDSSLDEYYSSKDSEEKTVFIAHHTADQPQVSLLRYQIQDERFGIEASDTTVTTPYQQDWKTNVAIHNIGPATHVICYVGPETYERPAVDWEIREAHKQGKVVIAIRPQGSNYKIPKAIKEHDDPVIEWDIDRVSYELDKG